MTFSGPNLCAISHLELVKRATGVPHRDVSIKGKPGTVSPGGAQPVSISWTFVRDGRNRGGKNKIKRENCTSRDQNHALISVGVRSSA